MLNHKFLLKLITSAILVILFTLNLAAFAPPLISIAALETDLLKQPGHPSNLYPFNHTHLLNPASVLSTTVISDDTPATPLDIGQCGTPDALTRSFTLSNPDNVISLNVGFNVNHPNRGELEVILTAPDGTVTDIISPDGLDTNLNYDLTLRDLPSGLSLHNGLDDDPTLPYYDRVANPSNPLSTFSGIPLNEGGGLWQLTICNTISSGTSGTYTGSRLTFAVAASCTPTIKSTASGNWNDWWIWNTGTVPSPGDSVEISAGHTVTAPPGATATQVQQLCVYGTLQSQANQDIAIEASSDVQNFGQIIGQNGLPGSSTTCGIPGSSIRLWGIPVYNAGGSIIQAGDGGNGENCVGEGGNTYVYGQDTFNYSLICAGKGGDTSAPQRFAAKGGLTEVWGKYLFYTGLLINQGTICAGAGGDSPSGFGGNGGDLIIMAVQGITLTDGIQTAGDGGVGGLGPGVMGNSFIDPILITLSGGLTRLSGNNLAVFGGDEAHLNLTNLSDAAISASGSMTLAVGAEGVIDLTGNTTPIINANQSVTLLAETILLDPGTSLAQLITATDIITGPSQILDHVRMSGPGLITLTPDTTIPVSLTVSNAGPVSDTYKLAVSDSAGWGLHLDSTQLTVDGISSLNLTLTITPQGTISNSIPNLIQLTATAQSDSSINDNLQIYATLVTKPLLTPTIDLTKTVGLQPDGCAAENTINVQSGTEVTYCYQIANTGPITLSSHTLYDNQLGLLLNGSVYTLTPGAVYSYTVSQVITTDTFNTATWIARDLSGTQTAIATNTATVFVRPYADLTVSPLSFEVTLDPDTTLNQFLTFTNPNTQILDWLITAQTNWLNANPAQGIISPNQTITSMITFDSTGLSGGIYTTTLHLETTATNPISIPVIMTVTAIPNTPPVAMNDTATVAQNSLNNIVDVLANDFDPDGDAITISTVGNAGNGSVSYNSNTVSYSPTLNFAGADIFTYTIGDGNGGSDTTTVTITVTAPPPTDTLTFDSQPLYFEPNLGQLAGNGHYLSRGMGGILSFAPTNVQLTLPLSASDVVSPIITINLQFIEALSTTIITPVQKLPAVVNYFRGNDDTRWLTDLPTYAGINYTEIYPGIHLHYDGAMGVLKGSYTVAPQADPTLIRWRYQGAEQVTLDEATGDLLITLPDGTANGTANLIEKAPIAWQTISQTLTTVPVSYTLHPDGDISFALGNYDPAYPLIIDPTLIYSTFLGGGQADVGSSLAVDDMNNSYVTGNTMSADFPTTLGGGIGAFNDAYIAKFNSLGQLVYNTYIGGNGYEGGADIVFNDNNNRVCITGLTSSTDFPVIAPPGAANSNAFVVCLYHNNLGTTLNSYLIAGGGKEAGKSLAIDGDDNLYVVGSTTSTDLTPITPDALYTTNQGAYDMFLAKFDANLIPLYGTYFGGTAADCEFECNVAVNLTDGVFVSGDTDSFTTFPLLNQIAPADGGGGNGGTPSWAADIFVSRFKWDSSSSTPLSTIYSTLLGGAAYEESYGLAVDSQNKAIVVGTTSSTDYPITPFAVQSTLGGGLRDAFATKLSWDGAVLSIAYSTYLGGNNDDQAYDIAIDTATDSAYITGGTSSGDFPLFNPSSTFNGLRDIFVTSLTSNGANFIYSTYLGGKNREQGLGIAVDADCNAYLTGGTSSDDFPIPNAWDPVYNGLNDAFLSKLGNYGCPPTMDPDVNNLVLNPGDTFSETITVTIPGKPCVVDVYFLVDTTLSMPPSPATNNMIDTMADDLLTRPELQNCDLAFGLGDYQDFPILDWSIDYPFKHWLSLTPAPVTFPTLTNGHGGDTPESQLYALERVANDINPAGGTIGWRPTATQKFVVWIGDSPGHDRVCDALTGLGYDITESLVINDLQNAGISVIAYDIGYTLMDTLATVDYYDLVCGAVNNAVAGQATRISTYTGGAYFNDDVDTLTDIVDQIIASTPDTSPILNVSLVPSPDISPFIVSISPAGGYGPLDPTLDHTLPFVVVFEGIPCSTEEQTFYGTLDVVVDGVVIMAKTVTIVVPPCQICHPFTETLTSGVMDDFDPIANSPEAPDPSPGLQTYVSLNYAIPSMRDYDDTSSNHWFGHTFTNLNTMTDTHICSATLEIGLKSGGANDSMGLWFVDSSGTLNSALSWTRSLADLGIASGSTGVLFLDLSSLPTDTTPKNILPTLNSLGYLDVIVQDDSAVDYIKLNLHHCCNCTPPPADMMAWWPLDEFTGAIASELVNGNNGTHTNGPTPITGMVDNALQFDGLNDYVEVPHPTDGSLDVGTGDFSIDAWLRTSDNTGVQIILDKRNEGNSTQGISLYLNNGQLSLQLADGGGGSSLCSTDPVAASCTNYDSGSFVADGQWHFIAVTVDRDDPTGGRFYVDGSLVDTFDPTIRNGALNNTRPLRLSSRSSSFSGYYQGVLDEVELFSRALDPAEITALYKAGSGGKCKAPDLNLTKRHIGHFELGGVGTYLLMVTNNGYAPTTGPIIVTDSLPPGATYLSGGGFGWSCSVSGSTVTCTHPGPLNPGDSLPLYINVALNNLSQLTNCAQVETGGDYNQENNTSCDDVTLTQQNDGPDLGDAPDSTNHFSNTTMSTYYPWTVTANFPTVYAGEPIPGPIHYGPESSAWLGPVVSQEEEADQGWDQDTQNNLSPPTNEANHDSYDDGVHLDTVHLPRCWFTRFEYDVNVVGGSGWRNLNVWFDFNQDGDFADITWCKIKIGPWSFNVPVREWAVRNNPVYLTDGYHNNLLTPNFFAKRPTGFLSWLKRGMWMRTTLTEWNDVKPNVDFVADGRGPTTGYQVGETEDYRLRFPYTIIVAKPDVIIKSAFTRTDGLTDSITLPIGAVQTETTIALLPVSTAAILDRPNPETNLRAFDIAAYVGEELQSDFTFQQPVTLTLHYNDDELTTGRQAASQGATKADDLVLLYLDETSGAWQPAACGPVGQDTVANTLSVPICTTGEFVLHLTPTEATLIVAPPLVSEGIAGEPVEIPLTVEPFTSSLDIQAYQFTLQYDPAIFQNLSVNTANTLSADWDVTTGSGTLDLTSVAELTITAVGESPLATEGGMLLTLSATLTTTPNLSTTLLFEDLTANEGAIPFVASPGFFSVTEDEPPVEPDYRVYLPLLLK